MPNVRSYRRSIENRPNARILREVYDDQYNDYYSGKKPSDLMKTMQSIGSTEDFQREFFEVRFQKSPESDIAYYHEWQSRLSSLNPTRHMDSESVRVYFILMDKYLQTGVA